MILTKPLVTHRQRNQPMRITKSKTNAFTLIELLIVVAIIAILAAIAVPNFLEAQTRAKSSRAAADMRAVALGMESYFVDNNKYPYTVDVGPAIWMVPGGFPEGSTARCGGITSPIAYLSDVPIDPFEHPFNQGGVTVRGKGPIYYDRPGFGFIDGIRQLNRESLIPVDAVGNGSIKGIGADFGVSDPAQSPRQYVLYSLGPDLDYKVPDGSGGVFESKYHLNNRYDPSNGTISGGNIIRYAGGDTFP